MGTQAIKKYLFPISKPLLAQIVSDDKLTINSWILDIILRDKKQGRIQVLSHFVQYFSNIVSICSAAQIWQLCVIFLQDRFQFVYLHKYGCKVQYNWDSNSWYRNAGIFLLMTFKEWLWAVVSWRSLGLKGIVS